MTVDVGRRTALAAAALAPLATPPVLAAKRDAEPLPLPAWRPLDDPEAAGWSRKDLRAFHDRLARTQSAGLLAVHGGRVLLEYGDVRTANPTASVRKSLLSILFGKAVAAGRISLDATLARLRIDDLGGLKPAEKQATVRDLLSARSGVYHPAANDGDDQEVAPPRGSRPHGSWFLYNNWDFNALGTIYERGTGRNLYDAFDAELARPLAMQEFDRKAQRKGGHADRSMHPSYPFVISTRDLARVGLLMLRDGRWGDARLVPHAWIAQSTRVVTPVTQMNPAKNRQGPLGYGYLWWVWDTPWARGPYRGAYTAHGMGGQHLTILPAIDLVVAHETPRGATSPLSHPEFWALLDTLVRSRRS